MDGTIGRGGIDMRGLGTLINMAAIVAGGLLGLFFGNLLKERYRDALIKVNGVAVLFLGIAGTLQKMITVNGSTVEMNGSMMMIGSLAAGVIIGEFINLEDRLEQFGEWLKQKSGSSSDNAFVNGFVTSSLTVCIGAMAVVGAIQDGMSGDYTTLAVKAILDFLIIMVMSASMGKGCIFSAIPVGILQGSVTLLAVLLSGLMTDAAINALSLVGNVMIFCVGVNLIWPKTFRVANMLPGVIIAMIWSFFI